ncbi:DNA-directed RNA polymerase subunit beta' [Glutamicibacter soli]|uniref:DNA-directed RNA polymerase subunit beta' n=1 Tax=Glutamicibacter soli TaxID=453836 RepID=A0A365YEN5_9MICC|nr:MULTISPECIES: DNA-directed RNA polymerase subunit beta' [Micrococcaceae]ALQ30165.1 DNA-directed RNA polymerase subunit beta' [Arthrobacter sp. YC-RL1]KLI88511.1 DNA-directed RNA polymerase subunit beta' [Arthrobacter sp. YC-RL1]NAZ16583.1 DNA-directed RNA polymerase subunit beta' [Glutamicibacter soli]RBM00493.1 DNA-directed RNA polymerase subunit beta' [Glutamicibacter soli]RKS22279.1 DNA-directed RNA polymerase subunit beta' [Arthrobacter sp. AG1021]
MSNDSSFGLMRINLATADEIRAWSYGEVKKPETINYRTLKPEKDGLFCEKIFGPSRDWECYCGKYKRVRFKGIICERCGVEVTRANVRRERMGHIELAAPVTHIWYFKGVPSRLGYLLDLAPKDLEKVIYFAAYMITSVNEERRHAEMPNLQAQHDLELRQLANNAEADKKAVAADLEAELERLEADGAKNAELNKARTLAEKTVLQIDKRAKAESERLRAVWERFKGLKVADLEGDEGLYRTMREKYGLFFEGSMGAEAIQKRLENFDLEAEAEDLKQIIDNGKGQKKARALKRLKVVNAFLANGNSPKGMVLDAVPVIPPELRPMVQLDGGRFATSDLNDLYRRVINRNNRLKRLLDLGAPEIIVNNEKRMLQEAVDSLFDNGRRGRPVTGPGNRPLKSLSDMLKGKQGRFRQNLLGKRVDYSGRSVIVVGPQLKLHQCGLPKQMALELFKPFVMKRLVDLNHAQNIKSAKRMVERYRPQVWDVLEEIITEHPVLLNRAPTLHRLGIQAFEPQLVEGKALQLHPLVCGAFNADFDGDQMAVHLPLSPEAQAEARILMLSSHNILKPSDGRPVALPSQDMIIGLHHLTTKREDEIGAGRVFSSVSEAIMAKDRGELHLNAPIKVRVENFVPSDEQPAPEGWEPGTEALLETSLGQVLFNDTLPADYPWVSRVAGKDALSDIVNDLAERYPKVVAAATLDNLKDAGFHWATRSGITVAISDITSNMNKAEILEPYEERARKVQGSYDKGLISDIERRQDLIDIWTKATDEVAEAMKNGMEELNTINRMVTSKARGNWLQLRQIAGIRGLVSNPKGEIIPRPIKSSYREGLSVLEYFIATHGARKGLADTALKTANSGYLTRRLVDVSQDVIVREEDCGTKRGLTVAIADSSSGIRIKHETVENSAYTRTLAADVKDAEGNVLATAGSDVGDVLIDELYAAGVDEIRVRSVLTCDSAVGTCALCYGRSLATGKTVDIGEAVGIIAAQSIGEPGTQLTMRTFHTGGVASADDITQGLPRIQELFEARTPKGVAPMSEVSGRVSIEDDEKQLRVVVTPDNGDEKQAYPVLRRARLLVEDGQSIVAGTQLTSGTLDPKQVLRVLGPREAQKFLVREVQDVYQSQGVGIHDKHVEVIVRQMLRRVTVIESGETELLPGELADRSRFTAANRKAVAEGKRPAAGRDEMMGITKASLATDSWLSAASFQETTRVLTQAAMEGKEDPLRGLKENVIIGKLIPAGTGLDRYTQVEVEPTDEAKATLFTGTSAFSSGLYDDALEGGLSPEFRAISMDDYDHGSDFR